MEIISREQAEKLKFVTEAEFEKGLHRVVMFDTALVKKGDLYVPAEEIWLGNVLDVKGIDYMIELFYAKSLSLSKEGILTEIDNRKIKHRMAEWGIVPYADGSRSWCRLIRYDRRLT